MPTMTASRIAANSVATWWTSGFTAASDGIGSQAMASALTPRTAKSVAILR